MDASSGIDKIFLVPKIALLQYPGVNISHRGICTADMQRVSRRGQIWPLVTEADHKNERCHPTLLLAAL